jgi:hypothetical protein
MMTKPEHEVAYQDLIQLVRKHTDQLSPLELLAVAANMVGKLLALQDQRKTTPERALEVISLNIEQGNRQAIEEIHRSVGSA